MNAVEKNRLAEEARLQNKALKRISTWKSLAMAVATLGVAITYAGFAGSCIRLFFGISGIVMILLGTFSAVLLNLGLRNGRKNVEKILKILDEGMVS